ncbi:MAG: hypothetical protein LBP72_08060 [Dysgonamonadaceae bacterium]|jgi:hypothetical protein|nr:hypothetical protein [Dysgonamonadaceae bacterium]
METIASRLEEMKARIHALSPSDKKFIEETQIQVLRRPFVRTTCGECYKDALIEMCIYLQKNKLMAQSNYALVAGVILHSADYPDVYTNANLTDEIAEQRLKENPALIRFFSHYPPDWETRIGLNAPEAEHSEAEQFFIILLSEKLKAGATKAALKEEYKEYEIEGKKVTVRALNTYIDKAKEQLTIPNS